MSLSCDNLNILRVLSKQTLDINKEVKDSSIRDPSLAKVVKYSIAILLSLDQFSVVVFEARAHICGFSAGLGHTGEGRRVHFG